MRLAFRHASILTGTLISIAGLFRAASASDDRTILPLAPSPAASAPTRDSDVFWRAKRVCGVNCVYLFLRHFGREADYKALGAELVRDDLASLADLKHAATNRGLPVMVARTDRRGLAELPKPLIAHLDLVSARGETSGHFVLVMGVDEKKGVACIDGTTAEPRTFDWPEFERDWTGHVVTLEVRRVPPLVLGGLMAGLGLLLGYSLDRFGRPALARAWSSLSSTRRLGSSTASVLGVLILVGPGPDATAADIPSLETIGRAYQSRYSGIRTILAEYHCEVAPMMSPEEYYEVKQSFDFSPSDIRYVIADDGRIHRSLRAKRHRIGDVYQWIKKQKGESKTLAPADLTFADISSAMRSLSPTTFETLEVFDGTRLWTRGAEKLSQNGVKHSTYEIVYIPRIKSRFFAATPLDWNLWAFRAPALPKDDERKRMDRIPDLFKTGPFAVAPETERIGTDECVVVGAPQDQTLWLLPDRGFAPRKREFWSNGQRNFGIEFGDWRPVKEGAWIAGEVVTTSYGVKGSVPPAYEGKPLERQTFRLTKLEINAPSSEACFRVEPEAGDFVGDETLVADSQKGKLQNKGDYNIVPTVSYQMPAQREHLDQVIANAMTRDRPQKSPNWLLGTVLWINLGVVAGLLLFRRRNSTVTDVSSTGQGAR